MESTVTIKTRTIMLTFLVMLAVLGAYFVGSSGPGSGASAATGGGAATSDVARITMSGAGEATGVPDELVFGARVSESSGDVSSALGAAGNTMHRVIGALVDQGVASKDIQTSGLSVHPVYDRSGGTAVLTGYGATESISVIVRSLPDAGKAISAAVSTGGNAVRISGVQLKIGNSDALLSKARADAVAVAKAKAEQYAKATGSSLGSVVSIREQSSAPRVTRSLDFNAAAGSAAALPIKAGTQNLKVTVKIVWSLT